MDLGTALDQRVPRENVGKRDLRENCAGIIDVAERRKSTEGHDFGKCEGKCGKGKRTCENVGVKLAEHSHVGTFLDEGRKSFFFFQFLTIFEAPNWYLKVQRELRKTR